ncbi:MAG: hypothetical protein KF680_05100 [Cryobacterium sp.]|nr:hypothetical protein [Cryobacterium sp.]
MGKAVAGRVLIIVAFVLTMLTIVPLALAFILGLLTTDATGYAFVPFLLLVMLGLPYLVGALVIAAVLATIGLMLGGYRGLGITTIVLAVAGAAGVLLWIYGVDAGWF